MEAALTQIAFIFFVLLLVLAMFVIPYFALRRRAQQLREQAERPAVSVSPYDGSIEPTPKAGAAHDPGVTGIFDRSGVARRE
jgi:hypothetical protein